MSFKIEKKLTKYNYTSAKNRKIKYIVIHYFGSLGTAKSTANYFAGAYRGCSAHYFLDEGETIYQCVEDKDIAWHCGRTDGKYVHKLCRNSNSIGIEVRPYKVDASRATHAEDRDWYFTDKIEDRLVEFVVYLMKKYNIPPENVIRHYDVTGKLCPRPYVGDDTNTVYNMSGNQKYFLSFRAKMIEKLNEKKECDFLNDKEKFAQMMKEWLNDRANEDNKTWLSDEVQNFMRDYRIYSGDEQGRYAWKKPVTKEELAQTLYRFFTFLRSIFHQKGM